MKKKLGFAAKLIICFGFLFSACNGGGSGTEVKTDSTTTSTTTSSDTSSLTRSGTYESDVYPVTISGNDLHDAYQKIKNGNLLHLKLQYLNIHKNPFTLNADGIDPDHSIQFSINLQPFDYSLPLTSDPTAPGPISQKYWLRPALIEKDSVDSFIKKLKNDSPSIDLAKDYAKYQIVITPQVITDKTSRMPSQFVGYLLSIEALGTKHHSKDEKRTNISKVTQRTNPCPACVQT